MLFRSHRGKGLPKNCGRQEKKLPPASVQSRERYILPRAAVRQIIRQSLRVKDFDKLDKDSIILLEQIRTIDKQRLKQYIGLMPDHIMARVDKALAISISLDN